QLTADGRAVLIHDESVDRTTDGTGLVADLTLEQIRVLDAGSWYDRSFAGTRVPELAEFLDLLVTQRDKRALLELKGFWTPEDAASILGDIYVRGVQNRVVFASFEVGTIENVRAVAP